MSLPSIPSEVYHTKQGTPYLREAGVTMISKPDVDIFKMITFLEGFDDALDFTNYIHDPRKDLGSGELLCKVAGQTCYMSFGPKRTKNKDAKKYFKNIISSGHGSVLEHANYSFLIYGISRSLTHELVRHRAGMAYSQVSQRYVDGSKLRFVERPEFQENKMLHEIFEKRIDRDRHSYNFISGCLMGQNFNEINTSGLSRTDARKKVNQTARAVLPNETEAPIVVTGNLRAWRHILEMRGSPHAETEIRNLAVKLYRCLVEVEPILFMDFQEVDGGIERIDL